jgi:hypothetical protein
MGFDPVLLEHAQVADETAHHSNGCTAARHRRTDPSFIGFAHGGLEARKSQYPLCNDLPEAKWEWLLLNDPFAACSCGRAGWRRMIDHALTSSPPRALQARTQVGVRGHGSG